MRLCIPVLPVIALTPCALADFVAPNGTNFPWVRGATPNSAYAQWESFTSPAGPNSPDVGSFVGGALPAGAPAWNAFDSSGAGFVTSGGNIYSFAGPTNLHVVAPNFDRGAANTTTIILQLRTQGAEVLPVSVNIGGITPAEIVELNRQALGGMGGFLVDTLYRWDLSGNALSYEIRFDSAGSSMSTDRIAVDVFTSAPAPTCYANCDESTTPPILNVADFSCFLNLFAAGDPHANCDGSTIAPTLNVADFSCFLNAFSAGCS